MSSQRCALRLLLLALPALAFVQRQRLPTRPVVGRSSPPTVSMSTVAAPVSVGADVKSLLAKQTKLVDLLGSVSPDATEMSRLRFALAFPNPSDATAAMRETSAWRLGEGKSIVESAATAVAKAMEGGGWDNEVVRAAAPYADKINPYISPKNTLTLSTESGDLVYVIRASGIEDKQLMDSVSVEQLADFFLYVKEVHSVVANARSERTGRLCQVIFANDITGVRKPPDSRFSKALTASSSQYEKLYPSLAGPTMILNLPFILQGFIGLFKPLFPKSVQERLKFKPAPVLANLKELTPLTTDAATRKSFGAEIDKLLQS